MTSSTRPGHHRVAVAQKQRVGEPGRDLLDVVGDQHQGRRVRVHRQVGQARHQVLAATQVQARGRLVEQQHLRVGHQRPGDQRALALALGQRAERALGEVADAHRFEQLGRAGGVEGVVLLTPAAEHRVAGADHDVLDQLVARHALGDGRRGEADARAQVEDVDPADPLAEQVDLAGGRVQLGRGEAQQRGLARAVRAEHHPALVQFHGPVEAGEEVVGPPADADTGHPDHEVVKFAGLDRLAHEAHSVCRRARVRTRPGESANRQVGACSTTWNAALRKCRAPAGVAGSRHVDRRARDPGDPGLVLAPSRDRPAPRRFGRVYAGAAPLTFFCGAALPRVLITFASEEHPR